MAKSNPLAVSIPRIVALGNSVSGNQSGAQSPSAIAHYATQVNANTNPQAGKGQRQRIRRGPSQVPGATRGRKPTRVAS